MIVSEVPQFSTKLQSTIILAAGTVIDFVHSLSLHQPKTETNNPNAKKGTAYALQ